MGFKLKREGWNTAMGSKRARNLNCGKCEVKGFGNTMGRVQEAGKLQIRVQWMQGDLE